MTERFRTGRQGGREPPFAGAAQGTVPETAHPLIDATRARALAEAREGDPFAVLGPHRAGPGWVVTALVPDAVAVAVELEGAAVPMRRHPQAPDLWWARLEVSRGEDPTERDGAQSPRRPPLPRQDASRHGAPSGGLRAEDGGGPPRPVYRPRAHGAPPFDPQAHGAPPPDPRAHGAAPSDPGGHRAPLPDPQAHGALPRGLRAEDGGCPFYRLRATDASGAVRSWPDPYRFGSPLDRLREAAGPRLWRFLGARPMVHEGTEGTVFAVWAPNAQRVSVVGGFNRWDGRLAPMRRHPESGIWDIFLPGVTAGHLYKFEIRGADGVVRLKADPFARGAEPPPATASVVEGAPAFPWRDGDWMRRRHERQAVGAPISIYEVHAGSWRRGAGHADLAGALVDHAADLGFTHIELMPLHEHPFAGSWGYQPLGLFAPTARHGTPDDLRRLVCAAHRRGLGVILDWVPAHFPDDPHGLARFDGTALYEHLDPREGRHPDWNTLIHNHGRQEVRDMLIANALYWLEEFHIDGLRVDAVASMLYRDYSRGEGEWIPNRHGGRENLESIGFLRELNATLYREVPGIVTIAEESTAFPGVTARVDHGGLGFGYKWNMGWMNDLLSYMRRDPVHRRHHHHEATFGIAYAGSENYILPISHDEVVHGKGSMLARMPGGAEEKFAGLRAFYAFMWAHPGKKLLFMGQEFAQGPEWDHQGELRWDQWGDPRHAGVAALVRDLNRLYRAQPALHRHDRPPEGFQWVGADADTSVFSWLRRAGGEPPVLALTNMTAVTRDCRIGLPCAGAWREILNTDAACYGGRNRGNLGRVEAQADPRHGQPFSAPVTLPGLSAVWFVPGA